MRENKNITLAIQGIIDPQFANYKRRIQYVADVFMPFIDGIEIGFFSFQAGELAKILLSDVTKEILREFKCNSIHVAQRPEQQVLREDIVCVMNMVNNLFSNGLVQTVSFHLDMAYLFELIAEQSDPGLNLLWENLGKDAHIGNTYDELTKAAIQYPEWGIVFDIAHAMEMESYGQPSLLEHFDTFKQRIRQVHLSWPGNLYTENQVGSDFKTNHSLVHLKNEKTDRIVAVLQNIQPEVITIEGVVPPGSIGKQLVIKEINYIQKIYSDSGFATIGIVK